MKNLEACNLEELLQMVRTQELKNDELRGKAYIKNKILKKLIEIAKNR